MEIQRTQSSNFAYPTLWSPTAGGASPAPATANSTPWLAPEMSAANEVLRQFWTALAPQQEETATPFFGRFLQPHDGGGAGNTHAVGIGEGDTPAPSLEGNTGDAGAPTQPRSATMAVGIGENDTQAPPFRLETARKTPSATMAVGIGENDTEPPPFNPGGNTGDAGAPGKTQPLTTAVGEGDTAPRPFNPGNTGDAGAPGKLQPLTTALGEGDR